MKTKQTGVEPDLRQIPVTLEEFLRAEADASLRFGRTPILTILRRMGVMG